MKWRTHAHQDKCFYLVGATMCFVKVIPIFPLWWSFLKGLYNNVLINYLVQFPLLFKTELKQNKFYKHICKVTMISRKTFEKVSQTTKKSELPYKKNALKLFLKFKPVDSSSMRETTSAVFPSNLLQLLSCSINHKWSGKVTSYWGIRAMQTIK